MSSGLSSQSQEGSVEAPNYLCIWYLVLCILSLPDLGHYTMEVKRAQSTNTVTSVMVL